jgi:hypothetical protein
MDKKIVDVPAIPEQMIHNVKQWFKQCIEIAQTDDFENIFKNYIVSFFQPLCVNEIFQRLSPHSENEPSDKKIQAVIGGDFIKEIYNIADNHTITEILGHSNSILKDALHRCVIHYIFERRVKLDFDKHVMIEVQDTLKLTKLPFPRIFKNPFQHIYYVILPNCNNYIGPVSEFLHVFILWIMSIFQSYFEIDKLGKEHILIQNIETSEDIDLIELIKEILFNHHN